MNLAHQSQRLVQNCLWTLRNLSDAATKAVSLILTELMSKILIPWYMVLEWSRSQGSIYYLYIFQKEVDIG